MWACWFSIGLCLCHGHRHMYVSVSLDLRGFPWGLAGVCTLDPCWLGPCAGPQPAGPAYILFTAGSMVRQGVVACLQQAVRVEGFALTALLQPCRPEWWEWLQPFDPPTHAHKTSVLPRHTSRAQQDSYMGQQAPRGCCDVQLFSAGGAGAVCRRAWRGPTCLGRVFLSHTLLATFHVLVVRWQGQLFGSVAAAAPWPAARLITSGACCRNS